MKFPLFNIRFHTQGQGAPLIDQCVTVKRYHSDNASDEVQVTYEGFSICPLWFAGILWAVAFTRRRQIFRPADHENDGGSSKGEART